MNNINIFFDTNSLKLINPCYKEFKLNETYYVIKNFIKYNKVKNIKLFIPIIVFNELREQYIQEYKSLKQSLNQDVIKIEEKCRKVGWSIEVFKGFELSKKDYTQYIENCIKEFIEQEKEFINVTSYPDKRIFYKVINRALKKQRPFFGGSYHKKIFTDAGFKDVIFLESVFNTLNEVEGDYLIVTRDKMFQELRLDKELEGRKGNIISKETGKEIIRFLTNKYGIEDKSKYIKFISSEYYKKAIESALKGQLFGAIPEIKINNEENNEDLYISVNTIITINGKKINITVNLSEENDLLNIVNSQTEELIYEW